MAFWLAAAGEDAARLFVGQSVEPAACVAKSQYDERGGVIIAPSYSKRRAVCPVRVPAILVLVSRPITC